MVPIQNQNQNTVFKETLPQDERIMQTLGYAQFYELGMKLFDCKNDIEAISCFDQVLKINPNFYLAYIQKSRSLIALQKYTQALYLVDKVLGMNQHKSLAYYAKACVTIIFGVKEQEAIEYYNKAISLKVEIRFNLALTLQGLGKLTKALECFDDAIKLNPVDSDLYTGKGMMNNYQQAIANFDEAITLNPADSFAFMYKDETLFDMKQFEEAYISLQKAQQLNPSDPDIYFDEVQINFKHIIQNIQQFQNIFLFLQQ